MTEFPSDWRVVLLKDAAIWLSGGTPSTSNSKYWSGDIPWISAASLKSFDILDSERRITALGAASGTRVVAPGATIFVVRGMSLKDEFRVGIARRGVAFGQDCKALIPAPGIDSLFLAYALAGRSGDVLKMVDEAGHGTGRLATKQLSHLAIGIPPAAEQRRITETLRTVDEAIRSTDRLIAKLEQAKQGLLHDLLTRGIDESGHLRDPMDCPDQFVDSSLGRLPRQWLVLQLRDVARVTSGATPSRSIRAFWRGGTIPWVKTTEVDFSIILDTEEKITLTALNSTALRIYPVGTVLVAMYGQGATRGRSAILGVAATTNQACAAILGNPGYVSQRFLFHYMRANYDGLRRLGHGSQQTNLSGSLLEDMLIALPSKREQKRIYDVLDRLDERSGHEHARARKLRLVKEGLTDDLLTGRVRVSAEGVSA